MNGFNPRAFAINMLNRNPNIANNPTAQQYMQVIQNGDSKLGSEIAQNICNAYGMSPQEALNQAKKKFGLP